MKERRSESRFELTGRRHLAVTLPGGQTLVCLIENLSTTGLRVRVLDGSKEDLVGVGDRFVLTECLGDAPEECLDHGVQISFEDGGGKVAWRNGPRLGLDLDAPIRFLADLIAAVLLEEGILQLPENEDEELE